MRPFLILVSSVILTGFITACVTISQAPEPRFSIELSEEDFELRNYEAMVMANVAIAGVRYDAADEAFVILANYINGNGTRKIAMPAPVTQQISLGDEWIVSFVMPHGETRESLPPPKDERIILADVSEHSRAVLRFSGHATDKKLQEKTRLLEAWMDQNNLKPDGSAIFAFYNHPLTLPFLRRNEIMYKLLP